MIEFAEYPKLLVRLINACVKEPQHCIGLLYFNGDKTARLDFVQVVVIDASPNRRGHDRTSVMQNMQHKFVELLQVRFAESNDEVIRRQITYRYNNVKSKSEILSAKLADFNAMVYHRRTNASPNRMNRWCLSVSRSKSRIRVCSFRCNREISITR